VIEFLSAQGDNTSLTSIAFLMMPPRGTIAIHRTMAMRQIMSRANDALRRR
jgi:hypothetical protein